MPKGEYDIWNFADTEQVYRLMRQIISVSKLKPGLYEVRIKERKRTRTLDQNAYWWAGVVQPWLEWLRHTQGNPNIRKEQAADMLKAAVLGFNEAVNKATGEVLKYVPDSRDLSVSEFSALIEGAALWLKDFADIIVIPSDLWWEMQAQSKKQKHAA